MIIIALLLLLLVVIIAIVESKQQKYVGGRLLTFFRSKECIEKAIGGSTEATVDYGTFKFTGMLRHVNKQLVQSEPIIQMPNLNNKEKLYTVIMIDQNAPGTEPNKGWRHWVRVNMKPSGELLSGGVNITPYIGPDPPSGSGNHSYIFSIYEQQTELPSNLITSIRGNWDNARFVKTNSIHLVGIAGFNSS